MDGTLSAAIAAYIHQRKQAKLEPLQKALNKVLEQSDDPVAIAQAQAEYHQQADPIESAYDPVTWLTDAASKANKISVATHVPKFTHSSAKASSVIVVPENNGTSKYLTTSSLKEVLLDFSVSDAKLLPIAGLLQLEVNGESLLTQVRENTIDALAEFTQDAALLKSWLLGFSQALSDDITTSHTLMKQVYFPINSSLTQEYHLLCPIYSSTLADNLFNKIRRSRFGDSIDIRDARKKGLYDSRIDISFPATAVQKFGGDNAQNVSQLNSKRYGQGFLLNCAPPTYQAQTKPPVNSLSIFDRQFGFKTSALVREFKAFLASLSEKDRNFKIRYKRDYYYVKPLIDRLLNVVAEIQAIPDSAGWSNAPTCNMKRAHQLCLDINNPDSAFQRERQQGDWLDGVANDFAHWLLHQLDNKQQYLLGDSEQRYFKKLCLNELRAFERMNVVSEEHHT
ncbi:type I-F CRISPR-associated protein Csy1 [Vibrio rhizosphaerae]|uniref:Type I-F CRISPR-associated protein Csy1 n=1 Tax=Vibrio rhizosphaerae TaxID=398736 RepID=A0ABU4IXW2_9VIBR|nr:type I-F CRISPR-associated protein Csy1 [Vibrio rhizosphaerae]MDW6094245.1 type I-F CRISPR-associated protein Csy1 [Vibrio rhizosphaerae]